MEKIKKIIVDTLIAFLIIGVVLAAITPITPDSDEYINNGADPTNYSFEALTTYSSAPNINLYLNDAWYSSVACDGITGNCSETKNIFGLSDGVYNVSYADADLTKTYASGNIIIDKIDPVAGDFNFQAEDFNVTYSPNCSDDNIDTSIGQYNNGGGWIDFDSGDALPSGSVDLRGECIDLAGNEAHTANTTFILPATPPNLEDVFDLPDEVVDICGDTYPCNVGPIDGGGHPVDEIWKLVFDKDAEITLTLDGGTPVGPSAKRMEHVIALYSLMEGEHTLKIDASDGANSATYTININVSNTGTNGSTTIIIEDPISPPPTPGIEITNVEQVGSNPYPGGTATFRYTLEMVGGSETRYNFIASTSGFEVPIIVSCEDDLNQTYHILDLVGSFNMNESLDCPGSGDTLTGLIYNVLVEYPISTDASGDLGGIFGVNLY